MTVRCEIIHLEYVDPSVNSDKFYVIFALPNSTLAIWGRNGSSGQTSRKSYSNLQQSVNAAIKVRDEKMAKGYNLVDSRTVTFPNSPNITELRAQIAWSNGGTSTRNSGTVPVSPNVVPNEEFAAMLLKVLHDTEKES